MRKKTSFIIALFLIFSLGKTYSIEARIHFSEASTNVLLADNGMANYMILTSATASPTIKQSAVVLADYLSKISGATFQTTTGDGSSGIAIGTMNDFSNLPFKPEFDLNHPGQRQGYEIKSHSNGVYIIGATPLAVEYAVFDFLTQLGYRQFFPMKKWEVIPKKERLEVALHIKEVPDYNHRRVWSGHGIWSEYELDQNHWWSVNRDGGYALNTGHAYNAIVAANKAEFDKHPEYYALIDGERQTSVKEIKFCISNPSLRQLVVNHALKQFQRNPKLESISMDPSDGGGWCQCKECLKMGSPSTRAVFLSNTVAQAVRELYQGKKIGMYAYNQHSPAPEIDVDKDVVVSVATSFISGGMNVDEIIDGWAVKGAVLGIREYYNVLTWSKLLPGRSKGSNLSYLQKSISDFYNKGARYLTSEACDDWIPSGLGYYVAEKLLWNIDEDVLAITDDFFNRAFGPSAQTIKEYYTFLDGSEPTMLASDPIGRMYRLLKQAREEAQSDSVILSRIDDLVLYTRYTELFKDYETTSNVTEKQVKFNELMSFIEGIKENRILHTLGIDKSLHWKDYSPDPDAYVKPVWVNKIYTSEEIEELINNGIANNELFDFQPIEFSNKLMPVHFINDKLIYPHLNPRRNTWRYYTWVDELLQPIKIEITGGLIAHYRDRGNVKVNLTKLGGASDNGTYETLIQTDASTPPNGITNTVVLTPKQVGLHAIDISDGNDKTADTWNNYYKTFTGDAEIEGSFYFYVPKGTRKVGMYHKLIKGTLYDGDDNEVFVFKNTSAYQSFPVAEGQDGKIWSFKDARGIIKLMTVPPYFSLNPRYMLLPEEVIEKDGLSVVKSQNPDAFITVWEPTKTSIKYPGIGNDYSIVVRDLESYAIVRTIPNASSSLNNPYEIKGLTKTRYGLEVTPNSTTATDFNGFRVLQGTSIIPDYEKLNLKEIRRWGAIQWDYKNGLTNAFRECKNVELTAVDFPVFATNMYLSGMFQGCTKLTGVFSSISNWDTSKVRLMPYLFKGATSFNQPLYWNVANVNNFIDAFNGASLFNQNLGNWTIKGPAGIVNAGRMFDNSGMDCDNYAATLIGWANNSETADKVTLGAAGIAYDSTASDARALLINREWVITDSGMCVQTGVDSSYNDVSEFSLLRNPVQEFAHFNFKPSVAGDNIVITDLNGKIIVVQSIDEGKTKLSIPLSHLQKGVYVAIYRNIQGKQTALKLVR